MPQQRVRPPPREPAADWDVRASYAPRPVLAATTTGWSYEPRPATVKGVMANSGYLLAAVRGGRASFVWAATATGVRGNSVHSGAETDGRAILE